MSPTLHTTLDIAEAPDDGFERWLIHGRMRTAVNRFHVAGQSAMIAHVCGLLGNWTDRQQFGLQVFSCPHCRVKRSPETTLIAHVAVARPESWISLKGRSAEVIEGFPPLLVHVLDCREPQETRAEKEAEYLTSPGIVWVIDPYERAITIIEDGCKRRITSTSLDRLHDGALLPRLSLTAAELFAED